MNWKKVSIASRYILRVDVCKYQYTVVEWL